jgi:hypothetical protein
MVQSVAINANGDMFVDGSGNVAFVSGAAAVGQNCVTAMRAVKGEMQYALTSGMPYAATAFNTYNPIAFEAAARKVIGGVTGVIAVTAFTVTLISNTLTYLATISTIYGSTTITGSV